MLFFSCKEKDYTCEKKDTYVENVLLIDSLRNLKNKAITGDTVAYKRLYIDCFRSMKTDEILSVSIVMANKYHFTSAYYHVYSSIVRTGDEYELDSLDSPSRPRL